MIISQSLLNIIVYDPDFLSSLNISIFLLCLLGNFRDRNAEISRILKNKTLQISDCVYSIGYTSVNFTKKCIFNTTRDSAWVSEVAWDIWRLLIKTWRKKGGKNSNSDQSLGRLRLCELSNKCKHFSRLKFAALLCWWVQAMYTRVILFLSKQTLSYLTKHSGHNWIFNVPKKSGSETKVFNKVREMIKIIVEVLFQRHLPKYKFLILF